MKNKAKKIRNIAWIVEILSIVVFFILNYFISNKGINISSINNRLEGTFNSNTVMILSLLLIASFMTCIAFIKKFGIKNSKLQIISAIILLISANCVSILNINKLNSYYIMLIAIVVVFICEITKMIFVRERIETN